MQAPLKFAKKDTWWIKCTTHKKEIIIVEIFVSLLRGMIKDILCEISFFNPFYNYVNLDERRNLFGILENLCCETHIDFEIKSKKDNSRILMKYSRTILR